MDLQKYISDAWVFTIKVVPNSQKTEIVWEMEDWTIKIKSRWIPEKWKVNKEIINFLSKELKIEKSKISIISGETSRLKVIKINKILQYI